ncbi:MAG: biotin synthase BioB [Nitrospinae bacterium]|nr:biotin synthase BioB [Nitrospinota bacterium]
MINTSPAGTREFINHVERKALANQPLTWDEAVGVMKTSPDNIFDLIASANRIRRKFKGVEISLCSIINAKSGGCPEDCAFCAQSVHSSADSPRFNLVSTDAILDGARSALSAGAHKYGIVTSGYGYTGASGKNELDSILTAVRKMKETVGIHRCASLGILDESTAMELKNAGVLEYHHNLETARSFFPQICSTHDYEEDVETVRVVKRAGLRACCGGIFGMGETPEQRVELAFTLKELDVDSIPLNFLNPIKGTKLENMPPLKPFEILTIIAAYRMILPDKDIKVAGGREKNLRDLQSLMFAAGANSTMVGNYLTTCGRPAEDDLQLIADLELTVKK